MNAAPRRRRSDLADALRRRVVGALSSGSLRRGERLPSAREVAAEIDADPRLVLAAYRILAKEGVVEIRRRSGIYVASTPQVQGGPAVVADGWLAGVPSEAVEHGIPATRMGDWLKRCTTTRRLRAAVVADTVAQLDAARSALRADARLAAGLARRRGGRHGRPARRVLQRAARRLRRRRGAVRARRHRPPRRAPPRDARAPLNRPPAAPPP